MILEICNMAEQDRKELMKFKIDLQKSGRGSHKHNI